MTQEKAQQLKALLSDPVYKPLTEFLEKILGDLKNIDNVREVQDPIDQAVELKAQKKAYEKVEEILNTIIAIKDLPDPTAPEGSGLSDQGLDETQKEK